MIEMLYRLFVIPEVVNTSQMKKKKNYNSEIFESNDANTYKRSLCSTMQQLTKIVIIILSMIFDLASNNFYLQG